MPEQDRSVSLHVNIVIATKMNIEQLLIQSL